MNWVCDWGSDIGLNTERVACGGASAGGNLALALALGLHEAPLAGLLLFYPVTGSDFETKSYRRYADGYGLSRDRMQQLFAMYDPDGRRGREPELTPRSATPDQILKANMPPVAFISAECDVLAEDSRLMAAHLEAAGVSTMLHIEPGVTHGFINRGRLIPAAEACLSRAAQFLETLS
jgi:acetyl esterase